MGGGSLDRFGPVHCVNRARETRSVDTHDYSSLTICFRYLAGALGISFIPVKSLLSSEVLERLEAGSAAKDVKRMKCPFTGEEYLLLRALSPDVSFVHVQISDPEGNSQIHGARWENEEQAKAGKRVVVITEELVPTEYIQRYPQQTIIPAHRVEAVIHQPFGAYPAAVFQCYDFDADHLKLYVNQAKSIERFPEYLNTYVLGTKDHWEYLEKVGGLRRMNELKADRILGY
jgi:glutaconate CoA-transferase, subunit A